MWRKGSNCRVWLEVMAVLEMPSRETPGARSQGGDPTADHQMWQVVKALDATGGVGPQSPVLDLDVRGTGLPKRERPGGSWSPLLLPMRALVHDSAVSPWPVIPGLPRRPTSPRPPARRSARSDRVKTRRTALHPPGCGCGAAPALSLEGDNQRWRCNQPELFSTRW